MGCGGADISPGPGPGDGVRRGRRRGGRAPLPPRAGCCPLGGRATESALAASQPEGRFFFRTAYRNDLEGILAGLFASVALQADKAYLIDDGELYGTDLANP